MKIIAKVGTNGIFDSAKGKIKEDVLETLAGDAFEIKENQGEIIIVTSGAVGCGKNELGGNGDIGTRQAQAAVGQPILMNEYKKIFSEYGIKTGQILLNYEDLNNPKKTRNLIETYNNLWKFGAVPIANENDTTAIEELTFGDNDILSLELLLKLDFDILINYTERGALIKNGKIVQLTNCFDFCKYDEFKKSREGFGGLKSKLECAEKAVAAGKQYYIAKAGDSIFDVLAGRRTSTKFYRSN